MSLPLDILKIDNLFSFANLTKLQLDNNLIENIEKLDHLVNLQWLGKLSVHTCLVALKKRTFLLDLSFNNIEKINGLENLVNLTDLSLHHNHITKLEGLDTLTKLDVLSIGDNLLPTLEDVSCCFPVSIR